MGKDTDPEFIDAIQKIVPTDEHLQNVEHTLTLGAKRDRITIYTCVMLMYDVSSDGIIMVVSTLGYTSYQAEKYNMERNQNPRKLALSEDAVSQLIVKGYIKRTGGIGFIRLQLKDIISLTLLGNQTI